MDKHLVVNHLPIGSRRTHGPNGEVVSRDTARPERVDRCIDADAAAERAPTIATLMTRNVECVTQSLTVESLIALLVDRNIGAVPVVDAQGWPTGIVSKSDVVRWCHEREVTGATMTVADIMMPIAFTLPEEAPLAFAAALMATEGVHHIPVVSEDNQVVGMISALDLVGWMAEQEGFAVGRVRTVLRATGGSRS